MAKAGAGSPKESDASGRPKNGAAASWFVPPIVIPAALVALVVVIIAHQLFS